MVVQENMKQHIVGREQLDRMAVGELGKNKMKENEERE
jgi:hypothetical protein